MQKLTANNIVSYIKRLDKNNVYNYIHSSTATEIKIIEIVSPEGPIKIKRRNPEAGESFENSKIESISSEMLWRIANAFVPMQPINIDRVLGASYNTRSALESLLVHTPQFYFCYPGRVQNIAGKVKIKHGHKHIIWNPDNPHKLGSKTELETNMVISEIPQAEVIYDSLTLPETNRNPELDINMERRHAQMQIALYYIGKQLNYSTWIAKNDQGIEYKSKKLGEYEGVLQSLNDGTIIRGMTDAITAALLIDCIWFRNGKMMPAVMEIEHSTGVTSGLTRMKGLQDMIPAIKTRYVIVAPDEDRNKVLKEINREQFKSLNAQYLPYSSVEELYDLCNRRKLKGVNDEFLDCYMENAITS